ncbi:MAG: hypothetical protein AAF998_02755 [Bacteroidota bacterium]
METVNYLESWDAAAQYVREYNEGLVVGLTKDLKPRYDLKRKLRTEHVTLLRLMIRLYSVQLRECDVQLLAIRGKLPPFETNSVSLGKVLDLNPRTIRLHIARLMDSRVITEKQSRGRKHNYKLTFHADVLRLSRGMFRKQDLDRIERQLQDAEREDIENEIRQGLPVFVASKSNKKNNLVGGETKEPARPVRIDLTGNPFSGNPANQEPSDQADEFSGNTTKQNPSELPAVFSGNTGGGRVAKETVKQEGAGQHPATVREPAPLPVPDPAVCSNPGGDPGSVQVAALDWREFEDYYLKLLSLIQTTLYPRLDYLAESQVAAIHRYFALKFAQTPKDRWYWIYSEFRLRVQLVQDYVNRKPGRFVPVPSVYFDEENPTGFEGTARWYDRMGKSTNKREMYAKRYKTVMRTWDGFCQTLMHHLEEPNWTNYREGHARIKRDYPGLLQVYDYVVLANLTGGRMAHHESTNQA